MSLHEELLEQARDLAALDPRRPKQGNLRRAVSSAYYAVFHLLVHEASTSLVGAALAGASAEINHGVRRWFDHGTMKKAAQWFQGRDAPPALNGMFRPGPGGGPQRFVATLISAELRAVVDAFIDLQEQRHIADYDLSAQRFTRQGTLVHVQRAEQAFADWTTARGADPFVELFLLLLLTGDRVLKAR